MRIDAHVHVYPPEIQADWETIAEKEPHFGSLCSGRAHKWATAEDVVEQMKADGVDVSWIAGFAFRDPGLCRVCNGYVIDAVKRSNGKLKGLAVVNPLSRGFEEEISRCREAGLIGVGELFPDGQVFDITDTRQTWRLVAQCHEKGMFLLLHVAEPVGHRYPGKGETGPKEAAEFCSNHPEVQVIFAHMGGGLWSYETMPEMRVALQNAWYDTAAAPYLYEPDVFASASAAGAGNKILYGSDFPLLGAERYEKMFSQSGLDEAVLAGIRGDNAASLLEKVRPFPGVGKD
ncbi:MAG: amidohydrolase family protein [Thermovirgaceae bacterium]|nr:amidohydrolase family protein [Thermovirgaceae bacterium]